MAIKIVLLTLWIIICLLEGRRDAFFYFNKMNSTKSDNHNIHWIFTSERGVILILIGVVNFVLSSFFNTCILIFSLSFIFSFVHNGMYYKTRNELDKKTYPKKWWDTSINSTSVIEFNPIVRTFLFIVGIIGIIATCTFY